MEQTTAIPPFPTKDTADVRKDAAGVHKDGKDASPGTAASLPAEASPAYPSAFRGAETKSAEPSSDAAAQADKGGADASTARQFVDRAARSAHGVIDAVASKVGAAVEGVGNGKAKIADSRDAWLGAARDAVRERPLAAIGIALLVGAAVLSLRSTRDR
jgi:hypothetical protein